MVARVSFGQGGPPMLTDDPGTPGNGKWENNIALTFEHRPDGTLFDLPQFDLNYGAGDHIQLNLQTAPVLLKRSGHGVVAGLSEMQTAVKWRFLDEDKIGFDMSTYPRLLFNVAQSFVRRGLADAGTRFQIPVEAAKKFGPVDLNVEVGSVIGTVGRSEWIYGIVAGHELSKSTSVMAELHGGARANFTRDVLTANVGLRHELTEHQILILSVGHDLYSNDGARAFIGYFGMQLAF
jgi:hypothetical protein